MIARLRWAWWTVRSWWITTPPYLIYITVRLAIKEARPRPKRVP